MNQATKETNMEGYRQMPPRGISDIELGKLSKSVEDLTKQVNTLEKTVASLNSEMRTQDTMITKGKTAFIVICGVCATLYAVVELAVKFIKTGGG